MDSALAILVTSPLLSKKSVFLPSYASFLSFSFISSCLFFNTCCCWYAAVKRQGLQWTLIKVRLSLRQICSRKLFHSLTCSTESTLSLCPIIFTPVLIFSIFMMHLLFNFFGPNSLSPSYQLLVDRSTQNCFLYIQGSYTDATIGPNSLCCCNARPFLFHFSGLGTKQHSFFSPKRWPQKGFFKMDMYLFCLLACFSLLIFGIKLNWGKWILSDWQPCGELGKSFKSGLVT